MQYYHWNRARKKYFEGWYFKNQASDKTISFIPSISVDNDGRKSSFLQIIDRHKTYCVNYSFNDLFAQKDSLNIKIGNNIFLRNGAKFNIVDKNLECTGHLEYSDITPIQGNAMGFFSAFPFMECNHGIVSMRHKINGHIMLNGEEYKFNDGLGYIEMDWGTSFPKRYVWVHCNSSELDCSIMVSVALIPFLGFSFEGCIGIINSSGKEYRLSTYNGVKILKIDSNAIILETRKQRLEIYIEQNKSGELYAPINGCMNIKIRECVSCKARFVFIEDGKTKFDFTDINASYENVGY